MIRSLYVILVVLETTTIDSPIKEADTRLYIVWPARSLEPWDNNKGAVCPVQLCTWEALVYIKNVLYLSGVKFRPLGVKKGRSMKKRISSILGPLQEKDVQEAQVVQETHFHFSSPACLSF